MTGAATAGMVLDDPQTFAGLLAPGARLAGLDIGTRTIGLATGSLGLGVVSARPVLARTRPAADLRALDAFGRAEGLSGWVAGLPRSMDGSDSPRTRSVRAQARNIAQLTRLPLLLWDERWSTRAVERAMLADDLSRRRRAERVDGLAAAWILEGALDRLRRGRLDRPA